MRTGVWAPVAVAAVAAMGMTAAAAQSAAADYTRLCSGCHGAEFRALGAAADASTRSTEELAAIIRFGVPANGMPAFAAQLAEAQILALAERVQARNRNAGGLGVVIEAETLDPERSANYLILTAEDRPQTRYVGYVDGHSSLCYANVDLTGARSIELEYARDSTDPGRFAIVAGDGVSAPYVNLGEKETATTGGWEKFERVRIGLERELSGRHLLCFRGVTGGGIMNLDRFVLRAATGHNDGVTLAFASSPPQPLAAAGHRFVLEKVADTPTEPWSMAFLADGAIITALKNGQLLMIRDGRHVGRIEGIPQVWNAGQGGLMAVKPHPEHARNGWIYLTFADPGSGPTMSMSRVVRGRLDGLRWVDQQDIYRAPAQFYTEHYAHFGSRIAFADGYLYFGIGDRQQPERVQDLGYPYGKIHRLHDDGSVPRDNPFVARADVLATIWSFGHRNPQGMTTHPGTGLVWSAEHGPAGGDEVNLLRRGANYGWPLVSFGTHYDGTPVGASPFMEGVEPPVHHFTPSIGISQVEFYTGDKFPAWRDQLLVASLGGEQLRLVRLREDRVMNDQLLFEGLGRIRDVAVGPDGYPYVLLIQHAATGIYRLRPLTEVGPRTSQNDSATARSRVHSTAVSGVRSGP